MTRGQDDKMTSWQVDKLTSWQVDKLTSWQDDKMTRWQDDKMTRWQDDMMTWWQDDMIKGSYDSNPKLCRLTHWLTYLLTRVKSRDASASKNENLFSVAGYCKSARKSHFFEKFLDVAELRLEKVTVRFWEIKFFQEQRNIVHRMKEIQCSSSRRTRPDQKRSASDFFGIRVAW